MKNKVSKAIMFYYNSGNGSYEPINELSGGEDIQKFIPKVELYWFDESDNSYKPLVTDGTLPTIGGGGGGSFDPSILASYAKTTYVDGQIDDLANEIINLYASKSYITTEIGKLDLDNIFLKKADASQTYATKNELSNKVDKVAGKVLSSTDFTQVEKDKLSGISSGANNYTLPVASNSVVGGVKVQLNSGIEVSVGGTLSATALKTSVDNHIADTAKHITSADKEKIQTIGAVTDLVTENKTSLVSAINEIKSKPSASTFVNVKDFGAKGDGTTDDTVAIQSAITHAKTNKNAVIFPNGRYKTTDSLVIYTGLTLKGLSTEGSIIEYSGTGTAVKFNYDERDMALETITIQSTNSATTTIGVLMESNLFCTINNVRVLDFGVGYKLDGKDKWCATNYIYNPFALRCKTGILLTADEGKQTNHTVVVGGYIVGYSPIQEGTKAIVIEQGDSNKFFGTAVEDYAVGYHFVSENAGGNSLISPRVENCTTSYLVEPNTVNTTIIDPFGGIEEANIQSPSVMFLSLEPTFRADNLVWSNNKGFKAYSSGMTPWEIMKVNELDSLEFQTPSFFNTSEIKFKVADSNNVHRDALVVRDGEITIGKGLRHALVETLPDASLENRGMEFILAGQTGFSKDTIVICLLDDAGQPRWYDKLTGELMP